MGVRLSDLPPSVQAKLRAEGKVPKRKRGMNRMERDFLAYLRFTFFSAWIEYEPLALKLGYDCRYTPDFVVDLTGAYGRHIEAFEVKGFKRGDAMVKLRVAAKAFTWIKFHLVERPKGDMWKITEIPSS